MKQQYLAAVLAPALFIAACGGKGYDQEIILQLFRPKVGCDNDVVVEANSVGQPGKTLSLGKSFFDSCSTNTLRIIPKQIDGKYPAVHVVVKCGPVKTAETTIAVPAPNNPVKLVLSSDLNPTGLIPAGPCSPAIISDGGPPPKGELGQPCLVDLGCRGGVCLRNQLKLASTPIDFPDGYCSAVCSDSCSGGVCQEFKNPSGSPIGKFCLKSCGQCNECPTPKLFCTPGSVCMPCTPGVNCC